MFARKLPMTRPIENVIGSDAKKLRGQTWKA